MPRLRAFVKTVGYTVCGREIKMLTKGVGEAKCAYSRRVHAREHITTDLLFALAAEYDGECRRHHSRLEHRRHTAGEVRDKRYPA